MLEYEQWLDVEPMAAPRHRARRVGKGIAFYHLKEYTDWLDRIRNLYGGPCFDCPVSVSAIFYLPKPKSVKRPYPSVKPDLDNYLKALLDGITGPAFKDDGIVVAARCSKRYAVSDPGIELRIREVAE